MKNKMCRLSRDHYAIGFLSPVVFDLLATIGKLSTFHRMVKDDYIAGEQWLEEEHSSSIEPLTSIDDIKNNPAGALIIIKIPDRVVESFFEGNLLC
jgi:hypothetical protein